MKYTICIASFFIFTYSFGQTENTDHQIGIDSLDIGINIPVNNLTNKDQFITDIQTDLIFKYAHIFPNKTQLAFAIIKNGVTHFYGIKRTDDVISNYNNTESIFEIGSITKVFTSTLLANLIIEGKIKPKDDINRYLPFSLNKGIEITFMELANHTSGLPGMPTNFNWVTNQDNPYKAYTSKNLEDYLSDSLEISENRKGVYEYSNLGAGILGYTLSEIEGVSYARLLQSKIYTKYNMSNTTSDLNNVKLEMVNGLDQEGNQVKNWEFSALASAGSILSNVVNLSKFAMAQFDTSNTELALTRRKTFEIHENQGIGLGWHIIKYKSGSPWHWHSGGTGGYSSAMAIDSALKNGVIILSNVSGFSSLSGNITDLCFELMKTLEDEK